MDNKIILPPEVDEAKITPPEPQTERGVQRQEEDQKYIPVIVKRTDEAGRHPDDILDKGIIGGLEQLNRPLFSLLLSSIAGGLILGFSVVVVAIMMKISLTSFPDYARIATALVYPLGFIICIMSGSQLFTEHTALAVYPVLDRKASLLLLFRLWIIVIIGNLIGAFVSAYLISLAEPIILAKEGYLAIAAHLITPSFSTLLISAVLAGWLMAQGGWLVLATPPGSSEIMCIYLVTFIIGIAGLHHSIAGSAEVFTALLLGGVALKDAFYFIGTALLGNVIGGSFFVAILNYAHIRQTQKNNKNV